MSSVKTYFASILIAFSAGTICGIEFKRSHVQTTTIAKTQEKSTAEQSVQSVDYQYSNRYQIVDKKLYDVSSGKIKEEITEKSRAVATRDIVSAELMKTTSTLSTTNYSKTTDVSNWGVGVFMPTSINFDPLKTTLQVSYRVVGGLYVSAQSDVKFSQPMIGIQLFF